MEEKKKTVVESENVGKIICAVVLGIIAIACFIFSYLQFHERGFLFNNAYIYASKEERDTMDKKPYYKQSGVAFVFIGVIFSIDAIMVLQVDWFFPFVIIISIIAILYAIVSTVLIERRKK